jgi:two-component system invasion response regulator UvrY
MKKISLMIVDDHTLIREAWSYLLGRHENFDIVAECGNGERAIELAEATRPDVVLLDINTAPLNKFEVLKSISRLSPGSKIIGVSMHSEPVYARKVMRLGAKGFVTKNSTRNEMMEAIREVVRGNIFICSEMKNILSGQVQQEEEYERDINVLTERELQVVQLISGGRTSKEIAADLHISSKTVEVHRHNVLRKMKLRNTASLLNYINSNAVDLHG